MTWRQAQDRTSFLNFVINGHILDCAYQNDPRLKKFREAEKQKKMELKQAKEQAEKEKEMVKSSSLLSNET